MKKKILQSVISIILCFSFTSCTLGQTNKEKSNLSLTQKQKLDDFEYMYNILKDNYPYFEVDKRLHNIDWLSKKDQYVEMLKATKSDSDFCSTLQDILKELNNGHTHIFSRDLYNETKKIFEEEPKHFSSWLKELNKPVAVKRYASLNKSSDSKNSTNSNSTNFITPNNVYIKKFEDKKVAYLSIKSFLGFNTEPDMKLIKPFLKEISSYKALIIDIRGNGGGDSRYWSDNIVPMLIDKPLTYNSYILLRGGTFIEPFLKCEDDLDYNKCYQISKLKGEGLKNTPPETYDKFKYYIKSSYTISPKDYVGFKGKIYLLTDKNVFSSSEALAVFCKSTGFATIVGEATGGDGVGGDPVVCTLPNSGYVFGFTREMGLNPDGSSNFEKKTEPDIKVPTDNSKYIDVDKDETIKTVLKLLQ
ncbi:S41 family peptidase [Clostridium manihotivorum]|uniref:Peptidase S41 n=1 Tax=Clostridium manihotivorum TaxID=2320868 RepID=A0A3R5QV50_9CLOT|nr:S41 family peptidase [Clostridium manihotivorum]QAA33374.1 peptidase S41 [Clostridium manihotivorum]